MGGERREGVVWTLAIKHSGYIFARQQHMDSFRVTISMLHFCLDAFGFGVASRLYSPESCSFLAK